MDARRYMVRIWEGRDDENVEAREFFDGEEEAERFLAQAPVYNRVTGLVEAAKRPAAHPRDPREKT